MNSQRIHTVFVKYRQIIMPLLLVLVFDLLLLGTNYFIAAELDKTATNINLAGRQRMLSQKMTKSLMLIHINEQNNDARQASASRKEFQHAISLFDKTLMAFSLGGTTISSTGQPIHINKLTDINHDIIDEAVSIWHPLKAKLFIIATSPDPDAELLNTAINALAVNNLTLLKLMNDLTNLLEKDSEKTTRILVTFQTCVVILIFLSFVIASLRLYRKETYYEKLMEKTTDLVISMDVKTRQITFINTSVEEVLGYPQEHFLNKPMSLLFVKESAAVLQSILNGVEQSGKLLQDRCEVHMRKQNGELIVADMVFQITHDREHNRVELSANIRDVSDRKRTETALAELAHKDVLTGLPNRALFYELLERSIARSKRYNMMLAILFIDLDHFKEVNDKYGHHIGDELLIRVAKQIKASVRESDTVCRFGGDEFIVLLDTVTSKYMVEQIAKQIIDIVSKGHLIQHCQCHVGASIGISLYPSNGEDLDTLVRKADTAMYEVKKSGKNAISYA